jgi:hypothetical protein
MTLPWQGTTPEISAEADSRYETPGGAQNKVNVSQAYFLNLLKIAVTGLNSGSESAIARYSEPYGIAYEWLQDRLDEADRRDISYENRISLQPIAIDRFRVLSRELNKESAIVVIGDSISEGSTATDFQNDAYVGILRKALNIEYANKNFGYESVYVDPTKNKYHTLSSFNFSLDLNPNYYGGVVAKSVINGAYLITTYIGKDLKLVYAGRADGGVLSVTVDGTLWGYIDTSVIGNYPNGCISLPIITSTWDEHVVIFQKTDTKPTDICGMIYYEDVNKFQPMVQNVSRSGIYASQIPNTILEQYTENKMVILALGVNDFGVSASVSLYRSKLEYVASRIATSKGTLIFVDFIFSEPSSNLYKKAMREVALSYPQFGYIDFAKVWFGNTAENIASGLLNPDGVHPTDYGHEQIAQVLLRNLNLPYSKQSVKYVPDPSFVPLSLKNGWTAFNSGTDIPAYRLGIEGILTLRGILKPGTLSVGVVMATLPKGRRPKKLKVIATTANGLPTEIKINTDGTVVLSGENGADFVTLDNISFQID